MDETLGVLDCEMVLELVPDEIMLLDEDEVMLIELDHEGVPDVVKEGSELEIVPVGEIEVDGLTVPGVVQEGDGVTVEEIELDGLTVAEGDGVTVGDIVNDCELELIPVGEIEYVSDDVGVFELFPIPEGVDVSEITNCDI